MGVFKVLFLFGLFTLIFSPRAQSAELDVKNHLPSYVAIQEALARDDLLTTKSKAKELLTQISTSKEFSSVKLSLETIVKAENLELVRKEFKKFSIPFVNWVEKNKNATEYKIIYCPMAGAKWIQKEGEIMNPYYGKEMLHCGEKTS